MAIALTEDSVLTSKLHLFPHKLSVSTPSSTVWIGGMHSSFSLVEAMEGSMLTVVSA